MLKEFRDFIARGNVLDLAVAVIIGAAFATITASLTERHHHAGRRRDLRRARFLQLLHFARPGPGRLCRRSPTDYAGLKKAGVAVLGWGQFVTVLINFLILAFIIFLLVRWANRMTQAGRARRPERGRAAHRDPRRAEATALAVKDRRLSSRTVPHAVTSACPRVARGLAQLVGVHDIAVADHRHRRGAARPSPSTRRRRPAPGRLPCRPRSSRCACRRRPCAPGRWSRSAAPRLA